MLGRLPKSRRLFTKLLAKQICVKPYTRRLIGAKESSLDSSATDKAKDLQEFRFLVLVVRVKGNCWEICGLEAVWMDSPLPLPFSPSSSISSSDFFWALKTWLSWKASLPSTEILRRYRTRRGCRETVPADIRSAAFIRVLVEISYSPRSCGRSIWSDSKRNPSSSSGSTPSFLWYSRYNRPFHLQSSVPVLNVGRQSPGFWLQ